MAWKNSFENLESPFGFFVFRHYQTFSGKKKIRKFFKNWVFDVSS